MDFKQKYLKYKFKYLQAKKLCNQIKKRQAKNMKGGNNTENKNCTLQEAINDLVEAGTYHFVQTTQTYSDPIYDFFSININANEINNTVYTQSDITLSSGSLRPEKTQIQNLHTYFNTLLSSWKHSFPEVSVTLDNNVPPHITIISTQLIQKAIFNILDNAAYVSDAIYVSITIDTHDIIILIKDEGPGISSDIVNQLSQFTVNPSKVTSKPSMGLRLSKAVISRLQGTLTFNIKNGTEVTIRLPLDTLTPNKKTHAKKTTAY